ncbi:MAG: HGPRTase-like protein [Candidatus Magasanikbacteria bacterium GW2011_GWA2_56_11]|uniref:HGPRTase-like protein n=1 Tax=Candidatus Magasanikbacteria bacterium GW2011_GWA2_56_11 TaxID=1619044 RepID=A0A0G1YIN9_9BACT|nr:MAG: HGPRTase-like protein [Candidatus Magasanikbacteria bacterium GW2011_GWA2_56_11]
MVEKTLLRESLLSAVTLDKGNYRYILHPISDGIPRLSPALLEETTGNFVRRLNWQEADAIVTVETMGIPVATALSLRLGLPLTVIRKRQYGLPGETAIGQNTGYGRSTLYINGVAAGDKVLLIDCVVSTGGTLISVLGGLKDRGAQILDVACVYGKEGGKEKVFAATGLRVKTLLDVRVNEAGEVRL